MEKDKLVYSTEKGGTVEQDIEAIKRKIAQIMDRQDPDAYAKLLLVELGLDPASESFKKRMAAFRRACNLPD
jgi:DnaJ-domain-containing protein 1